MNLRRIYVPVLAMACAVLFTQAALAGNGQNLLQNIPQNSAVVIHVNVEQVRSLPLYQMIWGALVAQPDAQQVLGEMEAQAGFDPNRDVTSLMVAVSGENDDHWAILVEGTFNVPQIGSYLATGPMASGELTTVDWQGHTVYFDPTDPEPDRGYFTFLNNNMVAAGTQAELDAIIGTVTAGGANITANAAMNTLVDATDMSGAFWFAGVMTPAMQAEMVGSPMEGMTQINGNGNFDSGLNVAYTVGTISAETATAMAAFFNAQLAQARIQPELQQMGLTSVLDNVTIANADTNVTITMGVPEQTLNQVIGIITALMAAEAAQPGVVEPTPAPAPTTEQPQ